LSGLLPKLALFFLLLALPTLVLVDAAVLKIELHELEEALADGALERASKPVRAELESLDPASPYASARVENALHRLIAEIERPNGVLKEAAADVLFELDPKPVRAALIDANGRVLSLVPPDWTIVESSDLWRFRHLERFPIGRDRVLKIGLDLQAPWWRSLEQWRIEWPILLLIASMLSLGAAWLLRSFVTRRIGQILSAAARWRNGEFSKPIGDTSTDELGTMARELESMARELEHLLHEQSEKRVLEERARLARDLHDVVKQKAFALELKLGALTALPAGDARGGALLLGSRALAHEIQRDLIETIEDLRVADRNGPLSALIEARARALLDDSDLALALDLGVVCEQPDPVSDAVLLVLTEALTNVLKHARAARIAITLARSGDTLSLKISDDGIGLRATHPRGQGLRAMEERARTLRDGALQIGNCDGGGAQVTLQFSLAMEGSSGGAP
jgi:signal transduction histidine kinase